jgi:hypothetical protein
MHEGGGFEHGEELRNDALLDPGLSVLVDYPGNQLHCLLPHCIGAILQVLQHKLDDLLVEEGHGRVLYQVGKDSYGLRPDPPVLIGDHFLKDGQY